MSIALATGIVLQGASGETRSQIERALGDGKFESLIQLIESDSSIESANKIYVANRFSLKATAPSASPAITASERSMCIPW